MKKYAAAALLGLLLSCSADHHDKTFIKLDNLPPQGRAKLFNNYDEVYAYFNDLSLKDKNEMIHRQQDNHPLVDSLKHLLDDMLTNSFSDMLPGQFEKKAVSVKK